MSVNGSSFDAEARWRPAAGAAAPTVPARPGRGLLARLSNRAGHELPRTAFGFLLQFGLPQQIMLLLLTAASLPVYYASLDLPKQIVDKALGGKPSDFPRSVSFGGIDLGSYPQLKYPGAAVRPVPAPGPDQRRLQIRDQRLQGRDRRAHAAAAALRAVLRGCCAFRCPTSAGSRPGRDGPDDQRARSSRSAASSATPSRCRRSRAALCSRSWLHVRPGPDHGPGRGRALSHAGLR